MWKETAIRLLVGIAGMLVGALFVMTLNAAALLDAERLQVAKARADAIAVATATEGAEEIAALAARVTTWPPRGQ